MGVHSLSAVPVLPELSDVITETDLLTAEVTGTAVTASPELEADDLDVSGSDSHESDPEPGFSTLGLPAVLLRAVTDLGYTTPSAIQAAAIPALLEGRDITGIAQTGTGKTAAFGLPLLATVDPTVRAVQALVLAPTRELAVQVAEAIGAMAAHLPSLTVVPIYGGSSFLPQRAALRDGAQIVVGTPGRVIDHLERGTLQLGQLRYLVLDEADEMLRMGFAEDVDRILSGSPASRQTALFSATMPPAIRAVAAKHLNNPVDVTVARQSSTVSSVRQTYAVVPFRDKVDVLCRYLTASTADATIVFVRTKGACDEVGAELIARGVSAAAINGDVPQKERERIIERLKDGRLDVLVATDVAARGLDVDRIDLVVNFDAPGEPEAYVHRIGRTGRAGRTGEALTFFTPREVGRLRAIERATRQKLEQVVPPTADQVAGVVAGRTIEQALTRLAGPGLATYRRVLAEQLAATGTDAQELAVALLALAAGDDGTRTAETPKPASFVGGDRPERSGDRGPARRERRGEAGPRYRLSVGHAHGVRPAGIVGAITGEGGLNGKDVGRIDIFDTFSTVEILGGLSADAAERISRATVSGQRLRVTKDDGAHGHSPSGSRGPRRSGPGRGSDRFDRGDRHERGARSYGARH
ncbi:DEAD/DEAH box helicase [Nakamurella leprariae]|uniref:RNA helicase n=1 Tax=Nakamurella leprariae TaxID=2803911 RepID=A0A939C1C8_9ACTN|nr:DEAD/DEAH box helicase [Nakamurella leprariae]MBM9467019.1 DEAD/DEAH box helicase [Nakamurella leprariae]